MALYLDVCLRGTKLTRDSVSFVVLPEGGTGRLRWAEALYYTSSRIDNNETRLYKEEPREYILPVLPAG